MILCKIEEVFIFHMELDSLCSTSGNCGKGGGSNSDISGGASAMTMIAL